jgi:hypothetical protein
MEDEWTISKLLGKRGCVHEALPARVDMDSSVFGGGHVKPRSLNRNYLSLNQVQTWL